jgi:hypothetical protein
MRRGLWISAGLLGALMIVLVGWQCHDRASVATVENPVAGRPAAVSEPATVGHPAPPPRAAGSAAVVTRTGRTLESRLREDATLLPLYRELRGRASNGDGEAAYYLYRIFVTCRLPLVAERHLEFGLINAADPMPRPQLEREMAVRRVHDGLAARRAAHDARAASACPAELQTLLAGEDPQSLLRLAAANGYARAQALAGNDWIRSSDDESSAAEAQEYLRAAVLAGDGASVQEVGRGLDERRPPSMSPAEAQRRATAWLLLACERGLECGADSALVQGYYCGASSSPRCMPGATLQDYLQRSNPANYAAAVALADEFEQAIRGERWADLGL